VRSLQRTLRKGQAANVASYIDFRKVSKGYDYVAVDELDSLDTLGRVVFEAGRPVAYSDEPRLVNGRWSFHAEVPGDMPKLPPKYVRAEAIVGPVPPAHTSLVVRPGRAPK
jgi:hypothetical protein